MQPGAEPQPDSEHVMPFISYGLNGEDVILWRALKTVENGFYIDVGAADPKRYSVTQAFYERGWNGINIEPTAGHFAKLASERTRDHNVNALIGTGPAEAAFYEFDSLDLSTMSPEIAQRHIDAGIEYRVRTVPVIRLADVCAFRGAEPIHFIKIDVEGAERDVLLSMDFKTYRPWIVVVEATEPLAQVFTNHLWEEILTSSDYLLAYNDGLNCYYVASEQAHLCKILKIPPSVFDEFIGVREFDVRQQAETWRQQLIETGRNAETWRGQLLETGRSAETWRRELLETRRDVECWRDRVAQLTRDAEAWRQALQDGQAETDALTRSLVAERELVAELTGERRDLRQHMDASRADIANRNEQIADLHRYIAGQHQRLHDVWSSASWRVTIPLRSLSRRMPTLGRRLRAVAERNPTLGLGAFALSRRAWRLLWLQGKAPSPTSPPGPIALAAPEPPAPLPEPAPPPQSVTLAPMPAQSPPRLGTSWLFLGDTIDWLQTHSQLTGVGKVTSELFLAAASGGTADAFVPCALAPTETRLASISYRDTVAFLTARSGYQEWKILRTGDAPLPPAVAYAPAPNDHVLFTGVVWTPFYADLFRSLSVRGVLLSVFVYDIIPIVDPQWVDDAYRTSFEAWLHTVLTHARYVFVSGATVRDHVLRWAALCDIYVSARVIAVDFGTRAPSILPDGAQAPPGDALAPVRIDDFVLCVGTVDRRKNQAMLCRLWRRLIDDLGHDRVPQLVLVGRDDLHLDQDDALRPMLDAGEIVLLQGLADVDLNLLYARCRFTAFPSLSEGYGLPVSESLAFGKLCIASDLAVIREHAGDPPWYFPPNDEAAAYLALRRAITDAPARQAAEARIRDTYRSRSWHDTVAAMQTHIAAPVDPATEGPLSQPGRLFTPGIPAPDPLESLRRADRWCTEHDPEVSFLIINWNACRMTRACIQNIWATTSDVRYEMVIADNGSSPDELRAIENLGRGVRLLPLGVNRFFGEACNIAAEHARGRLICLFNNDCFGIDGWLPRLVAAIDADPSVGAAGPLFLFPDLTVQEAGGTMDENGYPVRHGRGELLPTDGAADYLRPRTVDYISAAALLLRRDLYIQAGGFDLKFEPAYYEDGDLCFKLKALGYAVRFCPDSRAVHIEGAAANDDPAATARRYALGDLNRAKFVSRWGRYLTTRAEADLQAIAQLIRVDPPTEPSADIARTAALYTPYAITPGGGERFLLTIAASLMPDHRVTIVTPQPYSQLRLQSIAHEFGIDLSRCRAQTEAAFLADPAPDLLIVIGNQIVPPIRPRGSASFFVCQFPFPLSEPARCDDAFRSVLAYSDYAKAHIEAGLSAHQMPKWPVKVVYPPVPQMAGRAGAKKPMVLTVGRFFAGGHSKRHDLMIAAFRQLLDRHGGDLEMHVVGSSTPLPQHMRYLDELMQMAADLPIRFHVNAAPETLAELFRDAAIYWHATGLGADLARHPEMAEHFGISLVEAMSAECVALAFNAGGPREILTNGVDGFLYSSTDELVTLTADLLRPEQAARRQAIGEAAGRHARLFAPAVFARRVRDILLEQ